MPSGESPLIRLGIHFRVSETKIDRWYPRAFLSGPVRPRVGTVAALKLKPRQTAEQKQATAQIRTDSGNDLKL